ncbi:MAG: ApbE family lipoprotein [Polynucleobacter sp. 24-46-87]|jgi:thiamine biosynthesis lipoprotein|uniref:FAD:protein FMN transferase n=1 Tax=unclassified Polynucleobacter TaxID=2640945 RepID=UPI000BCC7ED6|nr:MULTISPECIES: FAD:protein FMN transferase [unclassified Polynucleobacter]OYY21336.1 MAG: ApbE family lipoprotein [Polynucleobacter sp. 35-46-11]OZA16209.1 MAG: ApbE family lipoprotein [Polynucleobacter sp. 24-46-87]OZA76482.1 MAG: ApbE family lipoprotein [Polynucleobacter sp. 39-46-10]
MIRCKPLLGTFVEISTEDGEHSLHAIEMAFIAIEQVQSLMGFHDPESELTQINTRSYQEPIAIHPWTAAVLTIAKDIHFQSQGIFNCGIGHLLVEAGLLPRHLNLDNHSFGGIEDLRFIESNLVQSKLPLCLDLGGIAKGYAVDKAVEALITNGIESGSVNAGGDMRVFGNYSRDIEIRNPSKPNELIQIGSMRAGAIATSGLYFAKRDANSISFMVNPLKQEHIEFSESYSVVAAECVYADALTKVVSISGNTQHPCLSHFSAQAIRIPNTLTR